MSRVRFRVIDAQISPIRIDRKRNKINRLWVDINQIIYSFDFTLIALLLRDMALGPPVRARVRVRVRVGVQGHDIRPQTQTS